MITKNYIWGSVIAPVSSRKRYVNYSKGSTWYEHTYELFVQR